MEGSESKSPKIEDRSYTRRAMKKRAAMRD